MIVVGGDALYIRPFDPWKSPLCTCPFKYTLNPYTGCSFSCKYCYITSYIRSSSSKPKRNLISSLDNELRKLDKRFPIDMSLSSDPYPPEEKKLMLTRKVLKKILPRGFKVQITTKSNLFVRDLDLLSKYNVAVSVTITTLDESLARRIEPNAPSPHDRLKGLEKLVEFGIPFSVRVDPIIPFLNNDVDEIRELIQIIASIGAKHVVTSTYKVKPDNFSRMIKEFPELEQKWRKLYYPKGKIKVSYALLPIELRKKLLKPVVSEAKKQGLTYATCREDLTTKELSLIHI